jgi:hypothetical protein
MARTLSCTPDSTGVTSNTWRDRPLMVGCLHPHPVDYLLHVLQKLLGPIAA